MECPYTDAIFLTSCIYDHYLNTQTSSGLRSSFLLELYTSEMTPAMEPSKSGNWPFAETTMTSCDGNVQGHFYICVPLQFQPIYPFPYSSSEGSRTSSGIRVAMGTISHHNVLGKAPVLLSFTAL